MGAALKGVVKWFNDAKGYGFITHESGSDVFVHFSVIESDGFKTLKDGEEVEYELSEGEKGLHAACVRRTNQPIEKISELKIEVDATNTISGSHLSEDLTNFSSSEQSSILDNKTESNS
ncbi:cold shock domain-containing protein [bacterium]|nr:cold shock domain-containing protein [bacterium]